jgi:hypothetical protein
MPTHAQNRETQSRKNVIGVTEKDLENLEYGHVVDVDSLLEELKAVKRFPDHVRKQKKMFPARRTR